MGGVWSFFSSSARASIFVFSSVLNLAMDSSILEALGWSTAARGGRSDLRHNAISCVVNNALRMLRRHLFIYSLILFT